MISTAIATRLGCENELETEEARQFVTFGRSRLHICYQCFSVSSVITTALSTETKQTIPGCVEFCTTPTVGIHEPKVVRFSAC